MKQLGILIGQKYIHHPEIDAIQQITMRRFGFESHTSWTTHWSTHQMRPNENWYENHSFFAYWNPKQTEWDSVCSESSPDDMVLGAHNEITIIHQPAHHVSLPVASISCINRNLFQYPCIGFVEDCRNYSLPESNYYQSRNQHLIEILIALRCDLCWSIWIEMACPWVACWSSA